MNVTTSETETSAHLPQTCLPAWGVADLPEPKPLRWTRLIGPGIVMMGIQIGGGEWLFGPEVTARYGAGLMWIATVAIVVQVFYNMECGRYALYCGEPIFTAFLRTKPGPRFWTGFFVLLSLGMIVPGLASQAAAVLAAFHLGRPPAEADRPLVMTLAYVCLALVVLPVLFGGKIYRMMLAVMTAKVFIVLGCTLAVGVVLVSPANWQYVFSGFLKFGEVPVAGPEGREVTVNALAMYFTEGVWPAVSLANIAVLGAFAGYAGGGGLGNSMYSNYVRDQGWGMGSRVGAIPSAIGGKHISLSHLGKVFPINAANLDRWKRWWKYIVADQLIVWAPGCFVGMALPALLSLQFAPYSPLYSEPKRLDWAQAVISADGLRQAPGLSAGMAHALWLMMLFVGLMVLLPSQMSVVEDVSRRWTDVIWSGSRRVRERMAPHQVSWIYYSILTCYVIWSAISMYVFTTYGSPKLMTLVISNLGNVALGFTSFFLLWVNYRLLPAEIQPRWYHRVGVAACGVFYLGMALLVFTEKQWPMIRELFGRLI